MELLPNDIRQHTFSRGMRGYNREEVEQFLEHVAEALEESLNGRRESEDKARRLKSEIERFKQLEGSLKEAVVTAQKAMTHAQEASSAESESLKRAAQNEAMSIVQEAETLRLKMEGDIRYLEQLRENHLQQFRGFLNAQLKTLEHMQSDPGTRPEAKPAAKAAPQPALTVPKKPKPEAPSWEESSLSPAAETVAPKPVTEASEARKPLEAMRDPQPWQPERIERDEDHLDTDVPTDEPARDEVKPEDAGEAVVAFPPPLVPGDGRRGE